MDTINNYMDIIDSRDVIERMEELRDTEEIEPEDLEELLALEALAAECESFSDWGHGETLIRDSYFTDYAQELAEDIGAINSNATWPNNCIDWDEAARQLQMDYSSVDFNGVTYWIRG